MSFFNPAGLFELSVEFMTLSTHDAGAARLKLAEMQAASRHLIIEARGLAEAAATQGWHRVAIAHETSVIMTLKSYPCLPEGSAEIQRSFHNLGRHFTELGQPLAAGWATALARGMTMRFEVPASCQLVVAPALYNAFFSAEPGSFVEIGAYDGQTYSNTAGLADGGWHGLYVEPHNYYLDLCRKRHGRNANVRYEQCAIGRTVGDGVVRADGPFSTVALEAGADDLAELRVPIRPLDDVLTRHALAPGFELLVIDVEGHEEAVFDGFDLAAWRPQMIIVELLDVHPDDVETRPAGSALRARILSAGYQHAHVDVVNSVFVRAD